VETKEANKTQSGEVQENTAKSGDEQVSSNHAHNVTEDEIDLAELIQKVWAGRKVIFIAIGIGLALGVFIAAISPEEFESSTTLLPESSGSSRNNQGSGLLKQFGGFFDMGSSGGTASLGTNMYPNIMQSTPFYLHIMNQELYFASLDSTVTVLQYFSQIKEKPLIEYVKRYTIGLPSILLSLPEKWFIKKTPLPNATIPVSVKDTAEVDALLKLSSKQNATISELKQRIITNIEKDGTVRFTTNMPDPYAAAQLTELSVNYLTQYVTEYRTEKVQQDLKFTEEQHAEAKKRFILAQERLAAFRDRNTNIATARAQTELERLQTEYNLAANVYQGLAQQLEQAKIKVQEETPVFMVLEPVQIPLAESEPDRKLIILAFIFLGIVVGFGIIFGKIFLDYIKVFFKRNV